MNRSLVWHQCLLIGLCALLYLPFLGSPVLLDFDEAYFASIAREMHENGEWIVPTINGSELGDKPILIFWGMLVSFSVFGVSEFAVRFPTVCWSVTTVLLTYHLARRLFHDAGLALRSAFILSTMLLFCGHSRLTTCDMATLCWTLAAITVYVFGSRGFGERFTEVPAQTLTERLIPWYPQRRRIVALMFACLGVATLAKGPALCVATTAVIGLFLLVKAYPGRVNRNPLTWLGAFFRTCLFMRPLIAVAAVLLVAGPWYLAVGYRTDWEWERMFFIVHNFERSVGVIRGHTGFPLYYLFVTLLGTFPWSIFFLPCLVDLVRRFWRGSEPRNVFRFLVCWIVLFFAFFSLFVGTKLPQYVMPAYPAIALLIGSYLYHWRRNEELGGNFWTPTVIGALCVVGLGTLFIMLFAGPRYFPEERSTALLIGSFLSLAGITAAVVYRKRGRKALDAVLVLLAVLFIPLIYQYTLTKVTSYAHCRNEFFRPVAEAAVLRPPLLVAVGGSDPSSTFYSGQRIKKLDLSLLESWRNSGKPASALFEHLRDEIARQDAERPKYLFRADDGAAKEGQIFLVVDDRDFEKVVRPLFGDTVKEIGRMRRFMRHYDIILLTTCESPK